MPITEKNRYRYCNQNIDKDTLSVRTCKSKEYYENRDKDVYPEITYDEFMKLYGEESVE